MKLYILPIILALSFRINGQSDFRVLPMSDFEFIEDFPAVLLERTDHLLEFIDQKLGADSAQILIYTKDTTLIAKWLEYKSKIIGRVYLYHPINSSIYTVYQYENNKKNGISTSYFPNGSKLGLINYRNGKRHGIAYSFDPTGYINSITIFKRNKKILMSYIIDENGNLSDIFTY